MAKKTVLGEITRKKIRQLISSIEADGVNVSKVILFGSYAKGKQHKWSDIDLAIVSPDFGKDHTDELMFLMKKAYQIDDVSFEPHPFHPSDFQNKYDWLISEIKRYGIELKV